jgi:hypothetical protein
MSIFLALALATTLPNTTGPSMSGWANCMSAYAMPRLASGSTERIVDGGFGACQKWENAAHKAYDHDLGPTVFVGIKYHVRQIMLRRIAQAKQMRGLR